MVIRRLAIVLIALVPVLGACSTVKSIIGSESRGEPTALKSAESRWLLIKNPRFGDVPSEPEYVWVEEDKVPTTLTTLIRGKGAIIATPEVVAKYGAPPGGGKISPRQGVPYQVATAPPTSTVSGGGAAPRQAVARGTTVPVAAPAVPEPKRGYVVYIDTTRIVLDLTAVDGMRPGTVISLRRDKIPIVHPVTGEILGELDEEVATARITETREKFSVAEIQSVTPGLAIQIRDRVVAKYQAPLRRGRPSANAQWGDDASVLVGDHLYSKSFAMLVRDNDRGVMETLARATVSMTEAEVFQLERKRNGLTTEADYLRIISQKTASFISACCRIGALLGGLGAEQVEALTRYGMDVGVAFQISDDALDFVADEERFGKAIGSDLREGKRTLPLIAMLDGATAVEAERVRGLLKRPTLSASEVDEIRCLVLEHDGVQRSEEHTSELQSQF